MLGHDTPSRDLEQMRATVVHGLDEMFKFLLKAAPFSYMAPIKTGGTHPTPPMTKIVIWPLAVVRCCVEHQRRGAPSGEGRWQRHERRRMDDT
jgi:hypothetical protein